MTVKLDSKILSAADLLRFMEGQDKLSDEDSADLAKWLKQQAVLTLTNAEKRFFLAASAFVLEYPAEIAE